MNNFTHLYTNFNRRQVFTQDDNDLVLNIILDLDATNKPVLNCLYGLFDGYLYNGILKSVSEAEEVSNDKKIKFVELINKIRKQ